MITFFSEVPSEGLYSKDEHLGHMHLKNFPELEIEDTRFYLCGPVSFMQSVKKELIEHGVSPNLIFKEVFGPDLLTDLN